MPLDTIVRLAGKGVRNLSELDEILIPYREGAVVEMVFYREDEKRAVNGVPGQRPT